MFRLPTARHALAAAALLCLAGAATAQEVTLNFNDALTGRIFYAFDGDANGTPDVVLSTGDAGGFNTAGPGPNMVFIREPGIEGTALRAEDLRINFLRGATGSISFSYALSTFEPVFGVTASLYDVNNQLMASKTDLAGFHTSGDVTSTFVENRVTVDFAGTAAYAKLNFGVNADGSGGVSGGGVGGGSGPVISDLPPVAALTLVGSEGDAPPSLVAASPSRYIIDDLSLTFAGTETLGNISGVVASDPVLPLTEVANGDGSTSFNFGLLTYDSGLGVATPVFIDPDVAVGYTYQVINGANVAAVLVPSALANGDASFTLVIDGVGSFALQAGVEFDIATVVAGGVRSFRIIGIDAGEALDPTNTQAFVTGLRFMSGGAVEISQTALTQAVPEPATYALWLAGLGALVLRRRARRAA